MAETRSAAPLSTDPAEVAKFARLAADWWNPDGPMKPLHRINPVRIGYIRDRICAHFDRDPLRAKPLAGLRLLDVGCGAGLLCEPMRRLGAEVTGIDPAGENLMIARRHAAEAGLDITYRDETIEALAAARESFDAVLAMEVVEHVPDVRGFVAAAAGCVAPGGTLVMSTLNRTLRSFALAIVGAEYVLRWLPRGTHDWERFVTPAELSEAVEAAGLSVTDTTGTVYNPLRDSWSLSRDTGVNYQITAIR